jgi:hypothetical protein
VSSRQRAIAPPVDRVEFKSADCVLFKIADCVLLKIAAGVLKFGV